MPFRLSITKPANPFLFFGKNPLPTDFEQQVEQILAKLDQEKKRNA